MQNQALRLKAGGAGIRLWEIAAKMGISDCYFSRLLRQALSPEMQERAEKALSDLIAERKGAA